MYLATGGLMGMLVKLLTRAVRDAIRDNRKEIGLPELDRAFRRAISFSSRFAAKEGPFELSLIAMNGGVHEKLAQSVIFATVEAEQSAEDGVATPPQEEEAKERPRRRTITKKEHCEEMAEALY